MRGKTKLGTHTRSRTSALKTTTVLFSGKCGFSVSPSSLQAAIILYSCPCRTSRFLKSVATTRTTTMLAYNTQQIMKFLAIQPVWYRVWHPENLLHQSTLRFTTAAGSGVCIIVSYMCTCLDHELRTTWAGFRGAHAQLSRVYFASTLDVTQVIKCARFSPSLARRAWERG